ncbi:MAG TPA: ribonucleoside triphosphate reductase, partial [Clostridiales bacterium]|nr:ribonucleoside triphosphate reductase [Clostridiales bacterium]
MISVVKRDGSPAMFDIHRISEAMKKAFIATGSTWNEDVLELLALRVTAEFQEFVFDNKIHVEDIQNSVESVLQQAGYSRVAKAYILYRKQREKMRNVENTVIDYKKLVNNYVKEEDWRVKENSTVNYSIGGLILHNSGAITANYWLSEVYDEEIAEAHKKAKIHIHDF